MDILFVIGFFLTLLLTGISLLGALAALVVATLLMLVGGLFVMVLKVLPWLLFAVVAVWVYRTWINPTGGVTGRRAKSRQRMRRGGY
ncbi:envelope stress response protein PspG [Pantoea eucrina]|uniref:Envelope stress response protein PspG n=1 Tax=Pantoea eucrina TaxID=472693 RepID=A0ABU5LIK0_9GAMM|nr:envelope stress response protein PspG [Pantoea eucrina]MDZ7279752.1 envelope stress response protein PspG [Pantoea eucrina]